MKILQLLLLLLLASVMFDGKALAEPNRKPNRKILFEQYLAKVGVQLDCYFTIERLREEDTSTTFLALIYTRDEQVKSLEELILKLRKDLPGFTITQDERLPVIVHIAQNNLKGVRGYGLNNNVSLTFKGTLGNLITQSGQQWGLEQGWKDSMPPPSSAASKTINSPIISFTANDKSVRDVLTEYAPLSQRGRVLWVALTYADRQPLRTKFWSFGRGSELGVWMAEKSLRFESKIDEVQNPFILGEVAYKNQLRTDENADFALQFIENQMKQKEPLQVRWAMFWLGKHKAEKGVPVLLKYLNYEYTPVPLLDERFPAFRALKEIGAPAAKAALGALPNETDARRLELMARIVLSVHGEVEGRKALQSTLAASKDITQQERLKVAIKTAEEFTPTATVTFPEELRTTPPKAGATPGIN